MLRPALLTLRLALAGLRTAGADKVLTGAFNVDPSGVPQLFKRLINSAGYTWLNTYSSTLVLYDAGFEKISGDLASSALQGTPRTSLGAGASGVGGFRTALRLMGLICKHHMHHSNLPLTAEETRRVETVLVAEGLLTHA